MSLPHSPEERADCRSRARQVKRSISAPLRCVRFSMAGGTRKKQEDRSVRLLFKDGKAVSRILMMIRS